MTALFVVVKVVFAGVLVSMVVSWQQMTRLFSIHGLICMPLTHAAPVDCAKTL